MSDNFIAASIAKANQFSAPLALIGRFNFHLSGTWVATVTVQRSF